jgi:hypothetical protein
MRTELTAPADQLRSAGSKLALLAARLVSPTKETTARVSTDTGTVIAEPLMQINAKESGSMGSFYMDEGTHPSVYVDGQNRMRSFTGCVKFCLQPMYRSVVRTDACPSKN